MRFLLWHSIGFRFPCFFELLWDFLCFWFLFGAFTPLIVSTWTLLAFFDTTVYLVYMKFLPVSLHRDVKQLIIPSSITIRITFAVL